MSQQNDYAGQLIASQDYFARSTRVLEEADSNFRPQPDSMTVAQQVAHTAKTLDWFVQGATSPEGFDLDFQKHAKEIMAMTSLTAARAILDRAHGNVVGFFAGGNSRGFRQGVARGCGDGWTADERHCVRDD